MAALGMNALALAGFGTAAKAPDAGAGDTLTQMAWIVTAPPGSRAVPTLPAPPAATPHRATPDSRPTVPRHNAKADAPSAESTPERAVAEPRPVTQPPGSGADLRFYATDEVDRPAEPDSDWNLDPAALDSAGLASLAFEIYVGRDGAVVACSILAPQALPTELRERLEQRLRETVVQPAVRNGLTVPSVRRIEVTVLPPMS